MLIVRNLWSHLVQLPAWSRTFVNISVSGSGQLGLTQPGVKTSMDGGSTAVLSSCPLLNCPASAVIHPIVQFEYPMPGCYLLLRSCHCGRDPGSVTSVVFLQVAESRAQIVPWPPFHESEKCELSGAHPVGSGP